MQKNSWIQIIKKEASIFIGQCKWLARISGQKLKLVVYQLYTISYKIVLEIVKNPQLVVFCGLLNLAIRITTWILVNTSDLNRAFLFARLRVSIKLARFILAKTSDPTRALGGWIYSTGPFYEYIKLPDGRTFLIYRNPSLEMMMAILMTTVSYVISRILVRILASIGIDVDHLKVFIILLFLYILILLSILCI